MDEGIAFHLPLRLLGKELGGNPVLRPQHFQDLEKLAGLAPSRCPDVTAKGSTPRARKSATRKAASGFH